MDEAALLAGPVGTQAALQSTERVEGASTAPQAPLRAYFGVQSGDAIQESQLRTVWDFAVQRAGTEDMDRVLQEVTNLRHMLGTGYLGDRPWMKMVSYIVALTDLKKAESTIRDLTV